MSKQEKIEYILAVMPNVEKIIHHATDKQIDLLYEEAQRKVEYKLEELAYV